MRKYNNQDHSRLTSMMAVENILAGVTSKRNLWEVNTEQEYHEQKAEAPRTPPAAPAPAVAQGAVGGEIAA